MMKYYKRLLQYTDLYQKISDKLEKSIMYINGKINITIESMNNLFTDIMNFSGNIDEIDHNILKLKIRYENKKKKLNKLLLFRTDYSLFRTNKFTFKGIPNIGYLIYLYRKHESKFNHIFYKFNEKAINFTKSMTNLKKYYNNKDSDKKIEKMTFIIREGDFYENILMKKDF